ncbi:CCA tRNA nucleotidyltransferase [Clostridiisalibacter paucivorans]|uniref:CCA tRNA nucleotidyltransferase n=1 Tax=Clostridiisalibacter paucivorans TaxID=408753 RepID=UPI00047CE873|nr:CCA tRNA nucleotidyltransferase [Clostridiisalibacter paucivorans]
MVKKIIDLDSRHIPNKIKKILEIINNISVKYNFNVYLTGGFPRDMLLKKDVNEFDLDFVIDIFSPNIINELNYILKGQAKMFKDFNTVSIKKDSINIDIAMARKELYIEPGKLPSIMKASIIQDVFRRDFTINTLLMDFKDIKRPKLIDYTGGLEDINKKYIRILHKNSFIEDPTRLYRAIKLKNRLGFKIEYNTDKLMLNSINQKNIRTVSMDRLFNEVLKILEEKNCYAPLLELQSYNLLEFIDKNLLNEKIIECLKYLDKNYKKIKTNFSLNNCNYNNVKLLLLLNNVSLNRLDFIKNNISIKRIKTSIDFLIYEYPHIDMILNRENSSNYDIYSVLNSLNDPSFIMFLLVINKDKKGVLKRIQSYLNDLRYRKVFLNGNDLKKLGIKPGPIYNILLTHVNKKVINYGNKTKKELIQIIQKKYNEILKFKSEK